MGVSIPGTEERNTSKSASVLRANPFAQVGKWVRSWLPFVVLLLVIAVGYEGIKLLAGPTLPINMNVLGLHIESAWQPPFKLRIASDLSTPHLWNIIEALGRPSRRGGPILLSVLATSALFTFREAVVGFFIGASAGLLLAIVLIHSRLLERALVPYVVASQTVPLIAIAPMIVIWLNAGWLSVAVIAAYLTFFPVTIAGLRGFKSVHPDALDLMHSYAASRRQILFMVRFPAAMPYLFNGFKLAASLCVIGAIVGELPSGISGGLGNVILNFNQYYITGPERLWAAMLAAALLGMIGYSLVTLTERIIMRRHTRPGMG